MRVLLTTILFIAFLHTSFGQDQWLVTTKLDTVYGRIFIDTGDPQRVDAARFVNENGKGEHKAYEVLSLHLGPNQEYITLKIDERYQFAKVDVKGKYVSKYLYKDSDLGSTSNFSLPILVNWKGEQHKIGRMTSRKKFAEYMGDCPSLKDQILSRDIKRSKDMEVILLRYNMCIEELRNQPTETLQQKQLSSSEKLQLFISELEVRQLYEGELVSMLKDIEQKIEAEEFVPKYLQQVVLSQLGENEDLKTQFLNIVEN